MRTRLSNSPKSLAAMFAVPTVALMARTRFWLKCALVGVGFMVPLAFVVTSYLGVQSNNTNFANKEQIGLTYLRPSVNLLVALTDERAANVEALFGSTRPLIRAMTEVQAGVRAMNRAQPTAAELALDGEWIALRQQIANASRVALGRAPANAAITFDGVTSGVERMITKDGNNSNIILDPGSDSYYLMDMLVNRLPTVIDLASRVSDDATVAGLSPPNVRQLLGFEDLKQNLLTATTAIQTDYGYGLANTRDKDLVKAVQPELNQLQRQLVPLLAVLTDAVNGHLDVAKAQHLGPATSHDALALEAATVPVAHHLLAGRIAGYTANSTRTEIITLLGLLFVLWLFFGFYLYMQRSVSNILTATAAVARRGDVDFEIRSEGSDEIAEVSRAVGEVMEYLRTTASAADQIASGDLAVEVKVKSPEDRLSVAFSKMVASLRMARTRDEAKVAHLETHDPLTGLMNRRAFEETLEYAIDVGRPGALVLLDLDNFKYVNETYGHKTGDILVAELARALATGLDDGQVLSRLGGDEFCVLAPDVTLDQAATLADEILAEVRKHVMLVAGTPLRTSASIGVTAFHGQMNAADLLADADRAMYTSKASGRDRVTVFSDEDRDRARQSMQTAGEHMIRSALSEERFELYVQPIVSLTTGIMDHCEVLLRMRSQAGELVPPGDFLPIAERLGLIHLIDHWVIEHAFREAKRHPDLTFEINLSGATIDDPGLVGFIDRQLRESGADPHRIVFELTETAAVSSLAGARELAHQLSDLGCEFAIDDFGAGFSTFYYLKHFPAKYVKIDGEFMNDPQSRMDELVIESIVRIGREVGKLTIAEYVADRAAMERAQSLGVDYGQGYFFSKPFPVGELASSRRTFLDLGEHLNSLPAVAPHSVVAPRSV